MLCTISLWTLPPPLCATCPPAIFQFATAIGNGFDTGARGANASHPTTRGFRYFRSLYVHSNICIQMCLCGKPFFSDWAFFSFVRLPRLLICSIPSPHARRSFFLLIYVVYPSFGALSFHLSLLLSRFSHFLSLTFPFFFLTHRHCLPATFIPNAATLVDIFYESNRSL